MTIENPELRRVMFRFITDLLRGISKAKREPTLPRTDRMMVLASVAIGTLEGRPFKVQKLAEYIGVPRTTILRRLEELEAEGWIEYDEKGHVLARADRLNDDIVDAVCGRMSTLIHSAHYQLLEIEQKENKTVQSGHYISRRE